jgi:hypothetical protein
LPVVRPRSPADTTTQVCFCTPLTWCCSSGCYRRPRDTPAAAPWSLRCFALHPINVESVAWIAERKNVLSVLFFLLALGAYRCYAQRPRFGRYGVVVFLFAMGLLAKPQVITFPFVLLLWDYWPLQRMSLRLIEPHPEVARWAVHWLHRHPPALFQDQALPAQRVGDQCRMHLAAKCELLNRPDAVEAASSAVPQRVP